VVSKMVFRIILSKHLFCYSNTALHQYIETGGMLLGRAVCFFFFVVFLPIFYFISVEPVVLDLIQFAVFWTKNDF